MFVTSNHVLLNFFGPTLLVTEEMSYLVHLGYCVHSPLILTNHIGHISVETYISPVPHNMLTKKGEIWLSLAGIDPEMIDVYRCLVGATNSLETKLTQTN
jgi:hypothetical protein